MHTKDHSKNGTNCLRALHARVTGRTLTVKPDSLKGRVVCGIVYGDMHLKDLLGFISRVVLYPGPGYLSSARWPLMPKKF